MKILKDLYYTDDHEWLKVHGKEAYIGITDYAQESLGDVVFVDVPEIDDEFEAGEVFGAVESVKAASDLFIPISGKILEINEELADDPGLLNSDAYENWIVKMEIADKSELEDLLSSEDYKKVVEEEEE